MSDIGETLALGTPQLTGAYAIADPRQRPSPDAAMRLLKHAWRAGIRYFDTAQAYIGSEEFLGQGLRAHGDARIITKLHPHACDESQKEIESRLEQSQARFAPRKLWAVLMHRDGMLDHWDGDLGHSLRRWRELGAVRHLGISVESVEALPRALCHEELEVIELPGSVFDRRAMRLHDVQNAHAKGKRIFVRSVFLQGLALVGVDRVEQLLPAAAPMAEALTRFCERHRLRPHQFALDYVRRRLPHATLVVGCASTEQLQQNCVAVRSEPCDPHLCDAWDKFWPNDDEAVIEPSRWADLRVKNAIWAIVQARMGSSRLPGKVLMKLGDRPVIQWVYDRASQVPGIKGAVVATSTESKDDELVRYCERQGIAVFRGSENDVLDRVLSCARQLEADAVMRITADCPLLDPAESARVVDAFNAMDGCQYASNVAPRSLPDGLDTEVVALPALEASSRLASDQTDREHVTTYVRSHPELFPATSVVSPINLSHYRLTLDTIDDLVFISAIIERLHARGQSGSLAEIVAALEDPELTKLHPAAWRPPPAAAEAAPS